MTAIALVVASCAIMLSIGLLVGRRGTDGQRELFAWLGLLLAVASVVLATIAGVA